MAEANEESILRNTKLYFIEILHVLTHFYSYRELEVILGEPMRTIWEYPTYRSIPEREKALKLLDRLKENGVFRGND